MVCQHVTVCSCAEMQTFVCRLFEYLCHSSTAPFSFTVGLKGYFSLKGVSAPQHVDTLYRLVHFGTWPQPFDCWSVASNTVHILKLFSVFIYFIEVTLEKTKVKLNGLCMEWKKEHSFFSMCKLFYFCAFWFVPRIPLAYRSLGLCLQRSWIQVCCASSGGCSS